MELEKYRNDQEVSQSCLVNMEAPAVTENHRDYNVRKSLKCSKRASQVEIKMYYALLRAQERPATLILTVISGFRTTRACHVYNRDAETGN